MRIIIANKAVIFLGMQGEDEATQVRFPVAKQWREIYGDGVFVLAFQRPTEDAPYACTVTEDEDGNVNWTITNTEVAIPGNGQAELIYFVEGAVAKSATYITTSAPSITAVGGNPPEPWESWIEDVMEAGTAAQGAAQEAAQSAAGAAQSAQEASDDATAALAAKRAAEAAQQAAETAQDLAEEAQAGAESAETNAGLSETAAELAATAAGEAQTATERARDQAETYSGSASESASDAAADALAAQGYAEYAQESAEAAQSWAENANDSQNDAAQAAGQAGSYAQSAEQAAQEAAWSAQKIADLTVSAHGLPEGATPTATKTDPGEGRPYNIDFGIPKGETGDCNLVTFYINPLTGIIYAKWTQETERIKFRLNGPIMEVSIQ